MDEKTSKEQIDELTHENRRLRSILDCLARAGNGMGASVDLLVVSGERGSKGFSVVVTRADADEAAFGRNVAEIVAKVMGQLFTKHTGVEDALQVGEVVMTGTSRNSESDGTPKGGA